MSAMSSAAGRIIYLDYAATTPVDAEVARAMSEALGVNAEFGNPASVTHQAGRRAEARVEAARAQVAALIGGKPADVVFTSGATESNNLAILGVARASVGKTRHVVTTKIEHKAVLDPCKQLEREGISVTYVAPDSAGRVRPESIRAAMRADTVLVSVMHANNEIGVIQDIRAIGDICRAQGVLFHVDAAQSVGKLPIDVGALPVDLLSFTAHKIYGPKGIGALYVRPGARASLRPVTFGGGQERGLRPGTLPTHQIVGFGTACDVATRASATEPARIEALRERLWKSLQRLEGVHLNGEAAPRLPGILNVSFEGVEGESLVTALTTLAVSTGSACSSASGDPSYVLRALGRSTQLAQSSLRFSLGRGTTEADIDSAAEAVKVQVDQLRAASPANAQARPPTPERTVGLGNRQQQALDTEQTSVAFDPLSPLARRYFEQPSGVGAMPPALDVIQGTAGGPTAEAWVRFHLQLGRDSERSIVKAALFQAYGCPHTLAVTAWVTEQLPGRSMDDLVPGTPAAWLQVLSVPMEKLGRLLTVEDALRDAFRQWSDRL
jgi:cysteine desulfurase